MALGENTAVLDYDAGSIQNSPDKSYIQRANDQTTQAYRSVGDFQAEANQGMEKSNLMGPGNGGSDSQSQALQNRASQIYGSNLNTLQRQSMMQAQQRQIGLQKQDINTQAAIYSNVQARAQLNYQQASFTRQTELNNQAARMTLFSQIFGGIIGAGGAAGGAIAANNAAKQQQPYEPDLSQVRTPDSYESKTFGRIGGGSGGTKT